MHRDVLTHFPLMSLVVFGQLLFFAIFLGAIVWVFRRRSREFYQDLSQMPLRENEKEPGRDR